MPVSCCAPGCTNRFSKGSGLHFYRFPKENEWKLAWQRALRRRDRHDPIRLWKPSEYDRVCSQHFTMGKVSTDPCHPDFVPSVFFFTPDPVLRETHTQMPSASAERYNRAFRRRLALTPLVTKENADPIGVAQALLCLGEDLRTVNKGTNTEPDHELMSLTKAHCELQQQYLKLQQDNIALQKEYQCVLNENRELKEKIAKDKFTFSNLQNSQINSLTGLPTKFAFVWLLSLISSCVKPVGKLCNLCCVIDIWQIYLHN